MKIKSLLYCTKATKKNDYLIKNYLDEYVLVSKYLTNTKLALNGKIVCECDIETEEIRLVETPEYAGSECNTFLADVSLNFETKTLSEDELCKQSCLDSVELNKYLDLYNEKEVYGYALHLSNVKERVMELSKCYKKPKTFRDFAFMTFDDDYLKTCEVKKAPQNMMWVYVKENGKWVKYLLISVRPQWLCLILNGEKDIEVRRKVLKGMCD